MHATIIQIFLRLRASYYFLPSLMVLAAMALAVLTTRLDFVYQTRIAAWLDGFLGGTVEGSRAVLSAIAGSMISVAAVTFSLTMVAVTSAAGQYGPRLISNFMRDRANQITLGTFLATFLYSLLVLRSVSASGADASSGLVPSLSVLVAIVMTILSVGVLIHFIHHIPETLNVGNITGKVAAALNRQIRDGIYPADDGLELTDCSTVGDPFDPAHTRTIRTQDAGFVQAVSLDGLLDWASRRGIRVRLLCKPGDFLLRGDPILEIINDDQNAPVDPDDDTTVQAFVAQGIERTAHQNILFLADELVEILARALSPGVNDPFTAINCIHWFGEACSAMMMSPKPRQCIAEPNGPIRIWAHTINFDDLCDVLFAQSRQYVCEDENAARAFFEMLYHLKAKASSDYEPTIDRHIGQLKRAVAQSGLGDAQKERLRLGPPYAR